MNNIDLVIENIINHFDKGFKQSDKIKTALEVLKENKATFKNANDLAMEVGNILSNVFKDTLNSDMLYNKKMYQEMVEKLVNSSLKKAHEVISDYSTSVMENLNKVSKVSGGVVTPSFNQNKANGIVTRLVRDEFEKVKWILDAPVKTFCQSVVDDTVKVNVKHHARLGLKPVVKRVSSGNCCDWCNKLAGVYDYPDVPKDVYRRHHRCDCVLEYFPGDGKKQNVWGKKKWKNEEESGKIEKRKTIANAKPKTLKKDDISTKKFTRGSGKNYPIRIGNSEHVKFDNEIVESVTVIAGKGTSVDIRDVRRLQNIYNEPEKRWEKTTGITYIRYKNKRLKAEIHWYEANGKRYEIKVRKVFDES